MQTEKQPTALLITPGHPGWFVRDENGERSYGYCMTKWGARRLAKRILTGKTGAERVSLRPEHDAR